MEAFSGLLFRLYRQAQNSPPTEFQTHALNQVREVLAFNSAIWVTGEMLPEGGIPHTIHLYHQPQEMMENWARIKHHDVLNFEAFSRLGETINAALAIDPYWLPRVHPEILAHIKRYGMEHILATIIANPVLKIFTAVSLYRADPTQPFTEAERLFKQNLMPHLAEVWNNNRFNFLHSTHQDGRQADHARAICDIKGMLHNASYDFENMMHSEWPDWHGPNLPGVLLDKLSGEELSQYAGHNIVVAIKAINDLLLICVRKKSTLDHLSPRELEVARCFGRGMEYRIIAEELHIAPVTVRNHLQAIYTKLGVGNKVDMARILFNAED